MRILKTINNSQMTKKSQTAATLGTVFYWDVFPGVVDGYAVLFARFYYSWAGLVGGGLFTERATMLPTSAAAVSESNYLAAHASVSYGTQFNVSGMNSALMVGAAADGSDWGDFAVLPNANSVGPMLPFPAYWTLRLSNGSTAYTAGTVTLDRVELYG